MSLLLNTSINTVIIFTLSIKIGSGVINYWRDECYIKLILGVCMIKVTLGEGYRNAKTY